VSPLCDASLAPPKIRVSPLHKGIFREPRDLFTPTAEDIPVGLPARTAACLTDIILNIIQADLCTLVSSLHRNPPVPTVLVYQFVKQATEILREEWIICLPLSALHYSQEYSTSTTNHVFRETNRADFCHIFIAVMGMTGVGKSSFIKTLTGGDVVVGHSVESCS
jgi:hypothetical protein